MRAPTFWYFLVLFGVFWCFLVFLVVLFLCTQICKCQKKAVPLRHERIEGL